MAEVVSADAKRRLVSLNQQLQDILFALDNRDITAPPGRIKPEQEKEIQALSAELRIALENIQQVVALISTEGFDEMYPDIKVPELDNLISLCLSNEEKISELNKKYL